MIRDTIDAALGAVSRKDWITLTDAMTLLSLCARQICADPVLNDNLDEIFSTGKELLLASADLNRQKQSFQDMYAMEKLDYHNIYKVDVDIYKAKFVAHAANDTILESKAKKLSMLRSSLYDTILYFDDHPLSEQVEKNLRESVHRWKDKLDQAQCDVAYFDDATVGNPLDDGLPYGDL